MNILYIIMRTDMNSMNPGKAMAQAAHAANAFVNHAQQAFPRDSHSISHNEKAFDAWRSETGTNQGFGTTIVLGTSFNNARDEMGEAVSNAARQGLIAGLVRDPTYPIRDGAVTHLIDVYTCAYVFAPPKADFLSHFELHP